MAELLPLIAKSLAPYLSRRVWWLAFSGGLDSQVLLHLVWRLRERARSSNTPFPEIRAIHINHQLQAASAAWAAQCEQQCAVYHIPFTLKVVNIEGRRRGVEDLARDARYREFEAVLSGDDLLLLAHHLDDQAETLLLRLLRGAGVTGLAAMPVSRRLGAGELYRPLLTTPRTELEAYAAAQQLTWLDDPSNLDTHYRRNFLRQRVLPLFAQHWPDYRQSFGRAAALQTEAAQLLHSYISQDLVSMCAEDGSLNLRALALLSEIRQRAVLRQFIINRSNLALSSAQLETIAWQFLHAGDDRQPQFRLAAGVLLRAYDQRLFCELAVTEAPVLLPSELTWDLAEELLIPGVGRLFAIQGGSFVPTGSVSIRFRRGGERCRLAGHAHHRPLKKLLQEWRLPPWQREVLPLIYCGDELAAVADLAICEGFSAAAGEVGWAIHWAPEALT
ncbi:MAG: tRNA lysidine(34) synthetase TilS [Zhongshania sp.]|uniref:tRNA lysidine(34) synthetase TilS n=1 Tax=Zhongshania sp. TaxID=1971902 RepID=UPI00261DBB57|nr:tRNA lysidine(34) synthetase TilS [Zhongshania sp.]MDF1692850.1 tRNA lysidine(34) synthetase TilS [Zhongshania sp.]